MRLTALMTLVAIMTSCGGATTDKQETPSYVVKRVAAERRTLTVSYPATIRGRRDVEIFPQVSGTITRVLVEEGQTVKRGQLLFVIDQVPYRTALHKAEANVEAARAAVSTAQMTYDGQLLLREKNFISAMDLRTSANNLQSAKAQLSLRRAELEEARNDLSHTEVRSPADGVVDVLPYREGALVSPSMSQPLTTVSDNATMYAYFSLTENQMLSMVREHGSKRSAVEALPVVELRLGDDSIYKEKGRIETISGMIDQQTGTVSVRAAFANAGGLLHSGGAANVLVPMTYEACIVVPRAATYEVQHLTYVYRVVGGKAKATVIEGERASASEFIVHKGLHVGDSIVTEGIRSLRDGMEI